MNNGKLNLILGALLLILLGGVAFLTLNKRNHPPYITVSGTGTLQYYDGISEEELLKGLRAFDQEDGDLTNKILVNSKMEQDGYMVVSYEVWDSSHAIGVFTRTFDVVDGSEAVSESIPESREEIGQEMTSQEIPEELSIGEGESESKQELTESVQEESQTELELEVETAVSDGRPVIRLKADSAVIQAGQSFPMWNYIETVEDDKDDFAYLSLQVVVSGQYDFNVPGNYTLEFWVADSDGNESDRQSFYLTVE